MKKLIAGLKVHICDECGGLCNEILSEDVGPEPTPEVRAADLRYLVQVVRAFWRLRLGYEVEEADLLPRGWIRAQMGRAGRPGWRTATCSPARSLAWSRCTTATSETTAGSCSRGSAFPPPTRT